MALPNIPAKTFSLSAVIVGYLLIDDLTANEQNALGNWLMLVAQVLSTNAFYKLVEQDRANAAMGANPNGTVSVEVLEKMIASLQREVDALKKSI